MTPDWWAWGVDVQTRFQAWAYVSEAGHWAVEVTELATPYQWSKMSAAHRQAVIHERALQHVGARLSRFPPAAVAVELPVGRFPKPFLMMAAGQVGAAAWLASLHVPTHFVPSTDWKRRVVGSGNAGKDAVAEWARSVGWAGELQDEADALGVAASMALELGAPPAHSPCTVGAP